MKNTAVKTVIVLGIILTISACNHDVSTNHSDDYKKGYNNGYDDARINMCQVCDDNAENDNQEKLCSTICN